MIVPVDGLKVYFPYEFIYPEQYKYMVELKRALDARGHAILEMPTGTGKTITALSLVTSYQLANPGTGKLIYCTRTVPEMEKVLQELQHLIKYREGELTAAGELGPEGADGKGSIGNRAKILGVGLSSRKNMCINPTVFESGGADNERIRATIDAKCRNLTASWVREAAQTNPNVALCDFFETLERAGEDVAIPRGVYTLEDLREYAKQKNWCPYFLARQAIRFANVVVYNYQYMLDPKISALVGKELDRECIVLFDEAHNIDNICVEALSVNITDPILEGCQRNVIALTNKINRMKKTDAQRLQDEYSRLLGGLAQAGVVRGGEVSLANPVLPENILNEAIPGNIRKAEHFVSFLRRFVDYMAKRQKSMSNVMSEPPLMFLRHAMETSQIERKPLQFLSDRLGSLLRTLEITDVDEFTALSTLADFGTLVSVYAKGFVVISEKYNPRNPNVADPVTQLACLDASIAIKPVFEKFRTVAITSGTLSPLKFYTQILNFKPVTMISFQMSLPRDCIAPLVITRGSDQMPLSSRFQDRQDPGVARNYGNLLLELSACVPDGIVGFFTSYVFMEDMIQTWNTLGILQKVLQHKLVFIETPDVVETSLALDNFKRACDCGRGAVFLSVARGKVAEGIDFDRHYGRCVVMFGVPYQYTESRTLKARLEYLLETFQIPENEFLSFDAMRQASQCVGRVIRSKSDFGVMILADRRYTRTDKHTKLPEWILTRLHKQNLNLSTDDAVSITRKFLRSMSLPLPPQQQHASSHAKPHENLSLWSLEHVMAFARSISVANPGGGDAFIVPTRPGTANTISTEQPTPSPSPSQSQPAPTTLNENDTNDSFGVQDDASVEEPPHKRQRLSAE